MSDVIVPRAGAAGLCESCRHVHRVTSTRGSTFYRCRRSDVDPAFPKYPLLPVTRCHGYQAPDAAPRGALDE